MCCYVGAVESIDEAGERSFDSLYVREFPRLLALAMSLTGDKEVATDVVQDAFVRAIAKWPQIREYEKPGAWIRRVVINLATDRGRRLKSERRALTRAAARPRVLLGEPELDTFWAEVRRLPNRQRSVIALCYALDLAVDDIAETLSVSVGTVTHSLHAARKTLAKRMSLEEDYE